MTMRPAWRLATTGLAARPSRTSLLVGAVALSAALIAAVACAMSSAQNTIRQQLDGQFGYADIRVDAIGTGTIPLDERLLETLAAVPGVGLAAPWIEDGYPIDLVTEALVEDGSGAFERRMTKLRSRALVRGHRLDQFAELEAVGAFVLLDGRLPERPNEVVIDALLAERLTKSFADQGISGFGGVLLRGDLSYMDLPRDLPERASSAAEADRLNAGVGVRLNDRVRLAGVGLDTPMPADQPIAVSVFTEAQRAFDSAVTAVRARVEQARRFGLLDIASVFSRTPTAALATWLGPAATTLDAWPELSANRPGVELTIVGLAEPPPLGGRPKMLMPLELMERLSRRPEHFTRIEILADETTPAGADPEALAAALRAAVGIEPGSQASGSLIIQTTSRITSGVEENMKSSRLGLLLAATMAFFSAAFIIATAMNTALAEQQRGLAVVRCIGGTRTQLAQTQIFSGLLIGLAGALAGIPAGVGVAWLITRSLHEQLPGGLHVPADLLTAAAVGAVLSGVIGAVWPAWRASRTSPLRALQAQAKSLPRGVIALTAGASMLSVTVAALAVALPSSGQAAFWSSVTTGLPLMFVGYFLLCVPVLWAVAMGLGPLIAKQLGLPPRLLRRTITATPFRYGLTAGAMMSGLALMLSIWINGGSFLEDWLDQIAFPDAFVNGTNITADTQRTLEELPFVERTAALSLQTIKPHNAGFGITSIQSYNTLYVGFDPEPFFELTKLEFVAGDEASALTKLNDGPHEVTTDDGRTVRVEGSILVGREFQTAFGLGPGDLFVCSRVKPGGAYTDDDLRYFEIAGVVVNPGLELVSQFFNVGQQFVEQSLHAVAGRREDLQRVFGQDKVALLQLDLRGPDEPGGVSDADAIRRIQAAIPDAGVIEVGSGRAIKDQITTFVGGLLLVFTTIAAVAMITAGLGVANLIAAAIEARKREFGILRSVGGPRSLLVRLVLGEALIVAITAMIVGTASGFHAAWTSQNLYRDLLGIEMNLIVPVLPILSGWGLVLLFTLAAAGPAMAKLNRHAPRELLSG